MKAELKQYMRERSALVDRALEGYVSRPGSPARLTEAMRYSLMGGGKRLRPILVIAGAELFGLEAVDVMPTACALEMIHTYSLIHDDLPCMDDDDLRRGQPTNHKVYGEAMAVLAGDALLTLAFQLVSEQAKTERVGAHAAVRAAGELAHAAGAAGMVGGQVEDLDWEGRKAGPEQLRLIHALKTGALFRASLRCGAILAGASDAELAHLDRYAEQFGLAFQIQDDILDVVGDVVKTGKAVGRDVKQDKSTYVAHYGLDGAQLRAREAVDEAIAALEPFGEKAHILRALATFVVDREG